MFLNCHTVNASTSADYTRDTGDTNPPGVESNSDRSKRRKLEYANQPVSALQTEPEKYQYSLIEPQQVTFSPTVSCPLDDLGGSSQWPTPGAESHPTGFGHEGVSAQDRVVPEPFQASRPRKSQQASCPKDNNPEITATFTASVAITSPLETW